jgi:hypothetical protein
MKRRELRSSKTSEDLMIIGRNVMIIIGKVLVVSVPARRSGIGVAKNCHNATTPHERESGPRSGMMLLEVL